MAYPPLPRMLSRMSPVPSRFCARAALAALVTVLAACGGGDGGGGGGGGGTLPLLNYSGNTNAAVLSTTNASGFVSGLFGSSETAEVIGGISSTGQAGAQAIVDGQLGYGRRLGASARNVIRQAVLPGDSGRAVSAIPIEEIQYCAGGGSIRVFGTLNDATGTGTLNIQYNNCTEDGATINGAGTFQVDALDFSQYPVSPPVPSDFTISTPRLELRGTGISRDVGGTLRVQVMGFSDIVTESLVTLDNLTGRMTRTDNLVSASTYDDLINPSFISTTVVGRYFDSVHGFVDVATTAPLHFGSLNDRFPRSGQLSLTGAGNRFVRVTAVSSTVVTLALDLDGSGAVERTATLAWVELSSPAAADLADADADGMHDSWEDANGLAKGDSADATLDPDGDGFTTLQEYQAATDPNDPASFPLTGPGGGSNSDPAPTAFAGVEVTLAGVSDLVYNPVSQKLYAAVKAGLGNAGSVVPINPANGSLGTAIPVGIEPTKLAVSDDGRYLYVGFDGQSSIQRIDIALPNPTVDLTVPLGGDAFLGPYYAEDIAVLPGMAATFAVSRKYIGLSPRHAGVAIYDGAVQRSNVTPTHTGSNVIEFSPSGDTVYGYNNEQSSYGFFRMAVDASGVSVIDVQNTFSTGGALIEGFNVDIRFNGGRIYATNGRVIDPVNRTILGTFVLPSAFGNSVAPDTAAPTGRVYFLANSSGWTVRAYSQTSAEPPAAIMSVPGAGATDSASSLVRWGSNGLAFRTSGGKVFVINSAALVP